MTVEVFHKQVEVLWDTGTQASIVSIAGLVRIYHH